MYVIYGKVQILIPHAASLKDKRQIINSIISRIKNRFNISISEIEFQDLWQRSCLGFAAISNSAADTELILQTIRKTLDYYDYEIEVSDLDWELIKD